MDTSKITRLQEEQLKAFQDTLAKIQQWETFKKDYESLEDRLKTLPDKVTHQVMVPFGPLAFMPGQLVHTNEIMVLLGDDWFAERSAKQARQVVERRIKHVQGMIKDLQKQKKLLEHRIGFTADFKAESKQDGLVDIREEYDAEKEAVWREERRKKRVDESTNTARNVDCLKPIMKNARVTEQKDKAEVVELKKVAQCRAETGKMRRMQEMEDALFARLDELEKQEEEFDEFTRMSDDDDDEEHKEDTFETSGVKKHVQWEDGNHDDEPVGKIFFQHSEPSHGATNLLSGTSNVIQSPADVYKLVQSSQGEVQSPGSIKPILKRPSDSKRLGERTTNIETVSKQPLPTPASVFTGCIVERRSQASDKSPAQSPSSSSADQPTNSKVSSSSSSYADQPTNSRVSSSSSSSADQPTTKRLSKFKAARQAKQL